MQMMLCPPKSSQFVLSLSCYYFH